MLVRCDSYRESDLDAAVQRGLNLLGGAGKFASRGEKIIFKPNILWGTDPAKCVVTHPAVFRSVLLTFKNTGAQLLYGDSPAGLQTPSGALRKCGHTEVANKLGVEMADFTHGVSVSHPRGITSKRLTIARGVTEADGLISLPKLKTHGLTRLTGAVKNQYGCVPGMVKGEYHARFPDVHDFSKLAADVCSLVNPRLYIMDAVMAMEGNGPQSGDPKKLGLLLFSTDPVALDAVAARIVDLDPAIVTTSEAGKNAGLGTFLKEEIELWGDDIELFIRKDFRVVRRPVLKMPKSRFLQEIKRVVNPRPVIDAAQCTRCGRCIEVCPVEPKAVAWKKGKEKKVPPVYDYAECIRCYCCHEMCPSKAIHIRTPLPGRILPPLAYLALAASRKFMKKEKEEEK
ncbi:MAG: DUF362 domain-containing protein [Chitinispirillaceae bacterium]